MSNLWYSGLSAGNEKRAFMESLRGGAGGTARPSVIGFCSNVYWTARRCGTSVKYLWEAESQGNRRKSLDPGPTINARFSRLIEAAAEPAFSRLEPQSNTFGVLLRLSASEPITGCQGGGKLAADPGEGGCGVSGLRAGRRGTGVRVDRRTAGLRNQRALRDLPRQRYSTAKSTLSVVCFSTRMASSSGLAAYFYPEVDCSIRCRTAHNTLRGYHEMLSCQRCIDAAAAVNVLIRTDTIIRGWDQAGVLWTPMA